MSRIALRYEFGSFRALYDPSDDAELEKACGSSPPQIAPEMTNPLREARGAPPGGDPSLSSSAQLERERRG
jgi:hypothetical protein